MIGNVAIIVAVDEEGGFAKDYRIPWRDKPFIKKDLKRFKDFTTGHVVVMGRYTYEEIHDMKMLRGKELDDPLLPNRVSFVLTRNPEFVPHGAFVAGGLTQALRADVCQQPDETKTVFIIGGVKVFIESLAWVQDVYCTIVKGNYACDKFFPVHILTKEFQIVDGEEDEDTYFVHYRRK